MNTRDDSKQPRDPEFDDEQEDREEDSDSGRGGRRAEGERREQFRRASNGKELMLEEVPRRAQRSDEKLKAHLAGKIMVRFTGRGERYLLDWSGGQPGVSETKDDSADCVIELSEDNLMRIASGELNPQIGMLSNKISISGRPEFAVYFFNLIAPRQSH